MSLIGLTLLASRFRQSRGLAMLLVAGCVVDFTLGIFLHLCIQHLENTTGQSYFSGPSVIDGQIVRVPPSEGLSNYGSSNWVQKHELANVARWRREIEATSAAGKDQVLAMFNKMVGDNEREFHGWYNRNGGEVTYLGDWFGAGDILSALLLLTFGGLMWTLWRCVPIAVTQAVLLLPAASRGSTAPPDHDAASLD